MASLRSVLKADEFVTLPLKKVVVYNHDSSTFIFGLPPQTSSKLPVASWIVVKATDPEALKDKNGNPVIRPYTPLSGADNSGELVLLVMKYDTGVMSKYIHTLKPGDTLDIKGPIEKFPFTDVLNRMSSSSRAPNLAATENEFDEVALIGGGSGITPLYQVSTHALASPTNTTKFKLIYSNITEEDILIREDIEALAKAHPDTLEVVYLLGKPKVDWIGVSCCSRGLTGSVRAEAIQKYVAPATTAHTISAGPPGQVAALAGPKAGKNQGELGGALKDLGYTAAQVFKF
ncbi:NADH-cytochrome b5 reductase [Mycena maculata]|uniref:cytochrome-b5 reductase n=1 Tax=Mycena maculata TaxID=230809 RepID=A0AAD7P022_9AGAR|nr:NADH-cytochrome b5 reductase [Mycena maculata]